MGMKQDRCPHCKKRRRKAESNNTKPEKRWRYFPMIGLVCFVCANKIEQLMLGPSDDQ